MQVFSPCSPELPRGISNTEREVDVSGTMIGRDKYISFALRNKRINHKSIIHRSGNSNQPPRIEDDEYVTRNCSHRYSARNVSRDVNEETFTLKDLRLVS